MAETRRASPATLRTRVWLTAGAVTHDGGYDVGAGVDAHALVRAMHDGDAAVLRVRRAASGARALHVQRAASGASDKTVAAVCAVATRTYAAATPRTAALRGGAEEMMKTDEDVRVVTHVEPRPSF